MEIGTGWGRKAAMSSLVACCRERKSHILLFSPGTCSAVIDILQDISFKAMARISFITFLFLVESLFRVRTIGILSQIIFARLPAITLWNFSINRNIG